MSAEAIYTDKAELYDAIYHWKDYASEAVRLREILHAHGVTDGRRVLEAACGTGNYLLPLSKHFDISGFDINGGVLEVARQKIPGAELWEDDLRSFSVQQPYDAVLCLFSSIGYLRDRSELEASAARFARATKPGGLLMVEPWFEPTNWDTGRPTVQTYQDPHNELALARAVVANRRDDTAVMDMHWLVARRGEPVEHFVERHEMWLCPHEVLLEVFRDAGFDVQMDTDGLMGRGMMLGARH